MDTKELLQGVFIRIKKYRIAVLACGLLFAVAGLFYALDKRTSYTAKATLFPLTSPTDKAISNSMLNGILGLGDAPKSFSEEATINIIELASSRRIRESVALTRLPQLGNKTIGELLITDNNENIFIFGDKIKMPVDSTELAVTASELLKPAITAKMSKNGVLELYYTGAQKEYITPISNVIIEKLSKFYVDLKRQKALDDYKFTLDKIDSLQRMINTVDRDAIGMQKRTMFTPADLLEYAIPKENVTSEKTRILRQRDMYINNRDEAVWRLQKVTPIIAVLDKPGPPYDVKKQPRILLTLIGFIAGCLLTSAVLMCPLFYHYIKEEMYRGVFGQ